MDTHTPVAVGGVLRDMVSALSSDWRSTASRRRHLWSREGADCRERRACWGSHWPRDAYQLPPSTMGHSHFLLHVFFLFFKEAVRFVGNCLCLNIPWCWRVIGVIDEDETIATGCHKCNGVSVLLVWSAARNNWHGWMFSVKENKPLWNGNKVSQIWFSTVLKERMESTMAKYMISDSLCTTQFIFLLSNIVPSKLKLRGKQMTARGNTELEFITFIPT